MHDSSFVKGEPWTCLKNCNYRWCSCRRLECHQQPSARSWEGSLFASICDTILVLVFEWWFQFFHLSYFSRLLSMEDVPIESNSLLYKWFNRFDHDPLIDIGEAPLMLWWVISRAAGPAASVYSQSPRGGWAQGMYRSFLSYPTIKSCKTQRNRCNTGWWFQTFFIFIPTWGRFPIWLIFFRWVETTN